MKIEASKEGHMMAKTENDGMTSNEAAIFLGVHPGTLANWRSQGVGPEYDKAGDSIRGRVMYSRRELVAFRETMRVIVRR